MLNIQLIGFPKEAERLIADRFTTTNGSLNTCWKVLDPSRALDTISFPDMTFISGRGDWSSTARLINKSVTIENYLIGNTGPNLGLPVLPIDVNPDTLFTLLSPTLQAKAVSLEQGTPVVDVRTVLVSPSTKSQGNVMVNVLLVNFENNVAKKFAALFSKIHAVNVQSMPLPYLDQVLEHYIFDMVIVHLDDGDLSSNLYEVSNLLIKPKSSSYCPECIMFAVSDKVSYLLKLSDKHPQIQRVMSPLRTSDIALALHRFKLVAMKLDADILESDIGLGELGKLDKKFHPIF